MYHFYVRDHIRGEWLYMQSGIASPNIPTLLQAQLSSGLIYVRDAAIYFGKPSR